MGQKRKLTPLYQRGGSRGVALLMSLSVILLLSIALMKTFERRSAEVAHLGANLDRFQAESLSRSGLKVILNAIREQGLFTIITNRSLWQGIDVPIGNGTFQIVKITPIDHRFNLNVDISRFDDPRITVFKNMVKISDALSADYNYRSGDNPSEALSAIIDWTDMDQMGEQVFYNDFEQYYREEPPFHVKNRDFDRLSEVRLLPAFRSLGFTADFLEQNFRVVGQDDEYIDVNLTGKDEMARFLSRYDTVEGFATAYSRLNDILDLIMEQRSPVQQEVSSDPVKMTVPFQAENFKRDWSEKLKVIGIEESDKIIDLFRPYSQHLFIQYQVRVGQATVIIRSNVQVDYVDKLKNLDISGLTILSFRMY
ncbi:general secretion pathway protein GspK [bacterium]|nr:general secretion pathway protein GspK [bacterium]